MPATRSGARPRGAEVRCSLLAAVALHLADNYGSHQAGRCGKLACGPPLPATTHLVLTLVGRHVVAQYSR